MATQLKVTRGRKLRTDGTVVETNIAYPSDSRLLADGVRVLSRSLKRLKAGLGQALDTMLENSAQLFRDRTRSARKQARIIQQAARRRSDSAKAGMQQAHRRLVQVTRASVVQAQQVLVQCHTQTLPALKRHCE